MQGDLSLPLWGVFFQTLVSFPSSSWPNMLNESVSFSFETLYNFFSWIFATPRTRP